MIDRGVKTLGVLLAGLMLSMTAGSQEPEAKVHRVLPGATDQEWRISIRNPSDEARIDQLELELVEQPEWLEDITIESDAEGALEAGAIRVYVIGFSVSDSPPPKARAALVVKVVTEAGVFPNEPDVRLELETPAAPIPFRLVAINGPDDPDYDQGETGISSTISRPTVYYDDADSTDRWKQEECRIFYGYKVSKAPTEIIPGLPFEFELNTVKKASGPERACRMQKSVPQIEMLRELTVSGHDFGYAEFGEAELKRRLTLRFEPVCSGVDPEIEWKLLFFYQVSAEIEPEEADVLPAFVGAKGTDTSDTVCAAQVTAAGTNVIVIDAMTFYTDLGLYRHDWLVAHNPPPKPAGARIRVKFGWRSAMTGISLEYSPMEEDQDWIASLPDYKHPHFEAGFADATTRVAEQSSEPGADQGDGAGESSGSGVDERVEEKSEAQKRRERDAATNTPLPPGVRKQNQRARTGTVFASEEGDPDAPLGPGEIDTTADSGKTAVAEAPDPATSSSEAAATQAGHTPSTGGVVGAGSQGPIRIADVSGMAAASAKNRLENDGFETEISVGAPARRKDDAFTVIEQVPVSGESADAGSTIKLTVHGDFEALRAPDVVGQSAAHAKATLEKEGLTVGVEVGSPAPTKRQAFVVASQVPAAGEVIDFDASVALTVFGEFEAASSTTSVVDKPPPATEQTAPSGPWQLVERKPPYWPGTRFQKSGRRWTARVGIHGVMVEGNSADESYSMPGGIGVGRLTWSDPPATVQLGGTIRIPIRAELVQYGREEVHFYREMRSNADVTERAAGGIDKRATREQKTGEIVAPRSGKEFYVSIALGYHGKEPVVATYVYRRDGASAGVASVGRDLPGGKEQGHAEYLGNWTSSYWHPIKKQWQTRPSLNISNTGSVRIVSGATTYIGQFDGKKFTGHWVSNASSQFYKCDEARNGITGWGEFNFHVVDDIKNHDWQFVEAGDLPRDELQSGKGAKRAVGYWNYCGLDGDRDRGARWWWGPYETILTISQN